MKRYWLSLKEHGSQRQTWITPHVSSRWLALCWLLGQRPYLVLKLDRIAVREWHRGLKGVE